MSTESNIKVTKCEPTIEQSSKCWRYKKHFLL